MMAVKLNGKTVRPPKKRITNSLMLDEKYTGPEPIFNGEFNDEQLRKVKIMQSLSYYNYFYSGKYFRKILTTYAKDELKYDKEKLELIAAAPDWTCSLQSGALLRMRSRGFILRDSEYLTIKSRIDDMISHTIKQIKDDAYETSKGVDTKTAYVAPVISIQDRIKNKTNVTVLGDLEDLLDEWISGASPSIDVYEAMKAALLPAQASKYVIDWAQKQLVEMQSAINKTDDQIVEGYSHLSTKRKKEYIVWYEGIIADAQRFGTNTKTVRKARSKKPVSLEKQISKLKYLKESPENKLVSINPAAIIGGLELWTYNVKYKTLTRYIADSGLGFGIKGTSLTNYSQSPVSQTRKLRKPELTLSEILSSSKLKAPKIFDALSTVPSAPNGRIGEDTILIKVNK